MKVMPGVVVLVAAFALLLINVPVDASASETDARIEASAKDSYVFKTYLKDDAVQVESKEGVVTLTGTVAEEPHISLAGETVASLPGVKSVDNRLVFNGEPAAANSDLWIGMKVKAALLFHRNVSAMTMVSAKDGIVTLQGDAINQAQKDLTTELVKDVEGVKDVNNEMTVSATPGSPGETLGDKIGAVAETIDDASITALVKMTLLYHRSTSALKTTVETNAGIVTVSGIAKNGAEKDLVTKLVQDVRGVNEVVNNMTIEETPAKTN